MTHNAPNGKFLPRMAICKWPKSSGEYIAFIKRFTCCKNEEEYLSLQEHEAILTEAANKIERLQAKISELDQAILTANGKIKEAMQLTIDNLALAQDATIKARVEGFRTGVDEAHKAWKESQDVRGEE